MGWLNVVGIYTSIKISNGLEERTKSSGTPDVDRIILGWTALLSSGMRSDKGSPRGGILVPILSLGWVCVREGRIWYQCLACEVVVCIDVRTGSGTGVDDVVEVQLVSRLGIMRSDGRRDFLKVC